jgi:hypothetical protein
MKYENDKKLLASYALCKFFYDQKKDIYEVIAEFSKKVIADKSLKSFTASEMKEYLNTTFEFKIPEAVIRTSLKRINLKRESGYYIVNNDVLTEDFKTVENETLKENDGIIDSLIDYAGKKIVDKKNDEESKVALVNDFCNYLLLDEERISNKNLQIISSFIVENSDDELFKKQIESIRTGVIVYLGIKDNNDLANSKTWKTNLEIYIDTEILFDLVGYNGQLLEIQSQEFIQLIKELNTKSKKIKLKYFSETEEEINRFFEKAEKIVGCQDTVNPGITAMVSIVNGCKSRSDVVNKKTDFFKTLTKLEVEKCNHTDDYYDKANHPYNISSKELVEKINQEVVGRSEYLEESLKLLNYVSILRKGQVARNFEEVSYVFLSRNKETLNLSFKIAEETNKKTEIGLATDLFSLTSKFWFKLQKGLGNTSLPKTFSIITKSQMALSSILNNQVKEEYEKAAQEFKEGKLNRDLMVERIIHLKEKVKKPEEVKKWLEEGSGQIKIYEVSEREETLSHYVKKAATLEEENKYLKNKEEERINKKISRAKNEFHIISTITKVIILISTSGLAIKFILYFPDSMLTKISATFAVISFLVLLYFPNFKITSKIKKRANTAKNNCERFYIKMRCRE